MWSNLKGRLRNLAARDIDQLITIAKYRLKRMQYQPGLLDGMIVQTGLLTQPP